MKSISHFEKEVKIDTNAGALTVMLNVKLDKSKKGTPFLISFFSLMFNC